MRPEAAEQLFCFYFRSYRHKNLLLFSVSHYEICVRYIPPCREREIHTRVYIYLKGFQSLAFQFFVMLCYVALCCCILYVLWQKLEIENVKQKIRLTFKRFKGRRPWNGRLCEQVKSVLCLFAFRYLILQLFEFYLNVSGFYHLVVINL